MQSGRFYTHGPTGCGAMLVTTWIRHPDTV